MPISPTIQDILREAKETVKELGDDAHGAACFALYIGNHENVHVAKCYRVFRSHRVSAPIATAFPSPDVKAAMSFGIKYKIFPPIVGEEVSFKKPSGEDCVGTITDVDDGFMVVKTRDGNYHTVDV